jgi:hypothetical protein
MAVHGVARSTRDVDLLVTDASCLDATVWAPLAAEGVDVTIRRGDDQDPLAGVVRLQAPGGDPLDVVVGRAAWQARVVAGSAERVIGDVRVPVAAPVGLILLKLYAGGPSDAWDVEQLLSGDDRGALVAEVEASLGALPEDARRLWARIVAPR